MAEERAEFGHRKVADLVMRWGDPIPELAWEFDGFYGFDRGYTVYFTYIYIYIRVIKHICIYIYVYIYM